MISVGGTGAKLTHALLHLSAAGILDRNLECLLVDSDGANGNLAECKEVFGAYSLCKSLKLGNTRLFKSSVSLQGPWKPASDDGSKSFDSFFHYAQKRNEGNVDADLMELLFSPVERTMEINEGFRGRPAIGASILADRIDFAAANDSWYRLTQNIAHAVNAQDGRVPVLFAGSVFGGTGAAGVPTIFRTLSRELQKEKEGTAGVAPLSRLGMTLMLPYFTFDKVQNEKGLQADPNVFPEATAEALRYYHERGFLAKANSIYALGEVSTAHMPVAAVGAAEQRNPAHFLELVAALGAARFFSGFPHGGEDHTLSLAKRREEKTLGWDDLPFHDENSRKTQVAQLKQMILFSVLFRYVYFPWIKREAADDRKLRGSSATIIRRQVIPYQIKSEGTARQIKSEDLLRDMGYVDLFAQQLLHWLLDISTSHSACSTTLVNARVFDGGWSEREFHRNGLFPGSNKHSLGSILDRACEMRFQDHTLDGTGYVIRALYDACDLFN